MNKAAVGIALAVMILAVSAYGVSKFGLPSPTSSNTSQTSSTPAFSNTTTSQACDQSLWNHVYNPSRLQVITSCLTVTGTVDEIRHEADGDLHILLKLDVGQEGLLNNGNIANQHGDLVLEPVCVDPVSEADAVQACSGFTNTVHIPVVGEHVAVTGSYVLDTNHGWNEIHPVTAIGLIG